MEKLSSNFIPHRQVVPFSARLQNAKGPIRFNMTNDYMFRAILQKNTKVLKGLICACLHLMPEQIVSIEVTNPIELGQQMEDKDFVLDIKVVLNDSMILNLEMQVQNEKNWPERSLTYLCRSFDQLQSGENYWAAKPAVHIGFLCFSLFPENPEFFATYKMMNTKTYHIYSDKLTL